MRLFATLFHVGLCIVYIIFSLQVQLEFELQILKLLVFLAYNALYFAILSLKQDS